VDNLVFRTASLQDRVALLKLEQKVVEAERPYNLSIRPKDAIYYDLDILLTSEASHVIVAEAEGLIIGTGYAQIRASKPSLKHTRHSYLGFMYVSPEYRGLGINKHIIDRLIDWSKEQGVMDFYLDVYAENEAAIRAYEKVGFAKSIVEMKINL
jgi:RimJ/RimL family protein N-acetyltransferase